MSRAKETRVSDVVWSLEDAVATITLNRPQARNALTAARPRPMRRCVP